jgi:hypothetical protein
VEFFLSDITTTINVKLRKDDIESLARLLDKSLQLIENLVFPIGGLSILSLLLAMVRGASSILWS